MHCRQCHRFPLENCIRWVSLGRGARWAGSGRSSVFGGVWRAGGQYNWKDPNGVSVTQDGADPSEAKVCRVRAPPLGACSCKYHTSNDVFSWCKSVHKMATGKSDDELIQLDDKMRIWTRSGKFRKVENPELSMA